MDSPTVERLLSETFGSPVRVTDMRPLTRDVGGRWIEDSPWIRRATLLATRGDVPETVIVKTPRTDGFRADIHLDGERAALAFLTDIGLDSGPRFLGAAEDLVIMEDLGDGISLDTLLLGEDPKTATDGLVAFATALGLMHAATAGRADEYYANHPDGDPHFDRTSLCRYRLTDSWRKFTRAVATYAYAPPPTPAAVEDWNSVLATLAEPGAQLAFSNGDTCPQNCRIIDGRVRFLDFEMGGFQLAALDLAAIRLPFPACACWRLLPPEVVDLATNAYAEASAPVPAKDLTVAAAAWAVLRAVRLPKLEATDAHHPMGISKRGQLLSQIDTLTELSTASASLTDLSGWFGELATVLRTRWRVRPTEPLYPAFIGRPVRTRR